MSEFKHAPGPWHVAARTFGDSPYSRRVLDAGGATVASARSASVRGPDMQAAADDNARLIAAAPDMAAALDAIHALLDRQNWGQGTLLAIADIIERTGREIREPVPLSCYQCGRPTDWPTPDSRCPACTRYTPEQVRGEAE